MDIFKLFSEKTKVWVDNAAPYYYNAPYEHNKPIKKIGIKKLLDYSTNILQ